MAPQDITLFVSRDRATRFAEQSILSSETFDVTPGIVRWHDGTSNQGFRVRVFNNRKRFVRFL